LIPMDIPPHRPLLNRDIDLICDTLQYVAGNREHLAGVARNQKDVFWQCRNPKIITRLWKEFFYSCVSSVGVK